MKIIVAIPGSRFGRRTVHSICRALTHLQGLGHSVAVATGESNNIYQVRNATLRWNGQREKQAPFGGIEYDRILWIDSDQVFTNDDVDRLLEWDLPIVAGWYALHRGEVSCFQRHGDLVPVGEVGAGLVEVEMVGFGFLSMKQGVLESIEPPWFEPLKTKDGFTMDDDGFAIKAQRAGWGIVVDQSIRVGHDKTLTI